MNHRNDRLPSPRPAKLPSARWRKAVPWLCLLGLALPGLVPEARAQAAAGVEFRVLHTFSALDSNKHNSDGAASMAPLLLGPDGNFYGTTSAGGANGTGTIFMLTPTGVFTTLYSFSALSNKTNGDGANPVAGLLYDSYGDFYRTAQNGGPSGDGTVFAWSADEGFSMLYCFSGGDGANPEGAVIFGGNGDLYGTTSQGGNSGAGTIFGISVHDSGQSESGDLDSSYSLNGTSDGKNPAAALLLASDGNFYGTAVNGGTVENNDGGYGTVFKFDASEGTLTTIYDFSAYPTATHNPTAPLIQGNDGNFYGTANGSYSYGNNAAFKLTPAGMETDLFSFGAVQNGAGFGGLVQGSDGNFYEVLPYGYDGGTDGNATSGGYVYQVTPGGNFDFLYSFPSLRRTAARTAPTAMAGMASPR